MSTLLRFMNDKESTVQNVMDKKLSKLEKEQYWIPSENEEEMLELNQNVFENNIDCEMLEV